MVSLGNFARNNLIENVFDVSRGGIFAGTAKRNCEPGSGAMERKMYPLTVKTTKDGMIEIEQDLGGGSFPSAVLVSPYQVDTLAFWLNEAVKEVAEASEKEIVLPLEE